MKESFEDFLAAKFENQMKLFLNDRKQLALEQRLQILLAGKVYIPRISCLKEIFIEENNEQKVIPIALKKNMPVQRFRLPFKSLG